MVPPCQLKGKEKSPCLGACVPLRAALVHRVTLSRLHDALSLSILICKMRTVPALFLQRWEIGEAGQGSLQPCQRLLVTM